jgi:hypothetical protein
MDALGWYILVCIVLTFAVLFHRRLRRTNSIPTWPSAVALITEIESYAGALLPRYTSTSDHCKVYYAFSVRGRTYEGWFVLMTPEHGFADDTTDKLRGKEVMVRYNPKHPKDSVLVDREILGKTVMQNHGFI